MAAVDHPDFMAEVVRSYIGDFTGPTSGRAKVGARCLLDCFCAWCEALALLEAAGAMTAREKLREKVRVERDEARVPEPRASLPDHLPAAG